jgi:hypothetical protein
MKAIAVAIPMLLICDESQEEECWTRGAASVQMIKRTTGQSDTHWLVFSAPNHPSVVSSYQLTFLLDKKFFRSTGNVFVLKSDNRYPSKII